MFDLRMNSLRNADHRIAYSEMMWPGPGLRSALVRQRLLERSYSNLTRWSLEFEVLSTANTCSVGCDSTARSGETKNPGSLLCWISALVHQIRPCSKQNRHGRNRKPSHSHGNQCTSSGWIPTADTGRYRKSLHKKFTITLYALYIPLFIIKL